MVVTTGFFDGVHTGHRLVIERLVQEAHRLGEESMVVTFWPHPRTVLQNGARELRLLTSLQEKRSLLRSLGVDRVEVIDFTREFSRLTAEEYLKEYIIGRFGATTLLVGYDHRAGCDSVGPGKLSELAAGLGLGVVEVERTGEPVSSTMIRTAVSEGDMRSATKMLGRQYSLTGVVVGGNRIGRTIGFPTANMKLYDPLKILPANGAYAVEVDALGGRYRGMCNIGVRPTVGAGGAPAIETNIFDFDEEIYGLDMTVRFICKIRDERRFPSLADLAAQLAADKIIAKSCHIV